MIYSTNDLEEACGEWIEMVNTYRTNDEIRIKETPLNWASSKAIHLDCPNALPTNLRRALR